MPAETESDCIFCQMVKGTSPCSLVYEDEDILSFLTIRQTRPGELLVIPKQHVDEVCDVPEQVHSRMFAVARQLARGVRSVFHPQRMGLIVHGYGVPHAHIIVLPQHHLDDITSARFAVAHDATPVVFRCEQIPETPRATLDRRATDIRAAVEKLDT